MQISGCWGEALGGGFGVLGATGLCAYSCGRKEKTMLGIVLITVGRFWAVVILGLFLL